MRILTFLHTFGPGGVERVALRLVRCWREEGVDAPLFMGRPGGSLAAEFARDLAHEVPRQPWFGTGWCETLWMIAKLPAAVRRTRPDVLFCAGNTYTIVSVALKLILGAHCPPIVAKISNDLRRQDMLPPLRWAYRAWLRIQAPFLDHVVAMSEAGALEIVDLMGKPAEAVSVVGNPIVSSATLARSAHGPQRAVPAGAGRRFVFVGRLEPQKNLPLMLRAFAASARPEDRLTIIGDGGQRQRLERLAERMGLDRQVIFAGHVRDPMRHLPDHDILLLSSDYEGLPAVVVEAIACGLTVIATDCTSSMAGLLGQGRFGRLVPVRDEAAFGAAIAAAVPDRPDRRAVADHLAGFTLERVAEGYVRLFSGVARVAGETPPAVRLVRS